LLLKITNFLPLQVQPAELPMLEELVLLLESLEVSQLELITQDGCVFWGNRMIVPEPALLFLLHEGHPGFLKVKRLARNCLVAKN